MRLAEHVAHMDKRERNAYETVVGIIGWSRTLVRPRRRWKNNIKIELKEVECEDVEWSRLSGELL
jgi:hypothetical protein